MSRDKLVDVNDPYHASVNLGCQGKSGPGKIHDVIHVHNITSQDFVIKLIKNGFVN